MEILQVVGIGLIATFLIMILKEHNPIFAYSLAILTGIIIFLPLVGKISDIFQSLNQLAIKSKVDGIFFETIIKIIGISYIAEFGSQIIKDAGQNAIASKIELAGKVLIMIMAIPIITTIINSVIKILPMG